jgi:hypothetical protein
MSQTSSRGWLRISMDVVVVSVGEGAEDSEEVVKEGIEFLYSRRGSVF